MAYGKRSKIKDGLENYNIMLAGEGGIGKTTLISKVCEKEFGSNGYLLLNIGDEDGVDCIEDVTYEDAPDYKTFEKICCDIIDNKEKDYPDLKVVVIDTVDQLLNITEKYVIKKWNTEHHGEQGFKTAKTINPVEGGFGNGMDRVFEDIYSLIRELKNVGVRTWTVCHVKTRDKVDALSGDSYTTLTSDMAQRYFEAFRTKMHVLGMACIDRTIVAKDTNRKDIMKKGQMVKINKVKESKRRIKFRDDNYSVDSKSRFKEIVDEIPMDPDEFIKAIKDAINGSRKNQIGQAKQINKKKEEVLKEEKAALDIDLDDDIAENEETSENISEDDDDIEEDDDIVFDDVEDVEVDLETNKVETESEGYPDKLQSAIKEYWNKTTISEKRAIKGELTEGELKYTSTEDLKKIYDKYIRNSKVLKKKEAEEI